MQKRKRADEIKIKIQMAKVEADKELALKVKEMELKAQDQASTNGAAALSPHNRDAKSPMLPAFVDEKDELDSYLLHSKH